MPRPFQLHDGPLGIDLGVRAESRGRGFDRLLLARREGAQRMLDAVAELAETVSGTSSGFWVM